MYESQGQYLARRGSFPILFICKSSDLKKNVALNIMKLKAIRKGCHFYFPKNATGDKVSYC